MAIKKKSESGLLAGFLAWAKKQEDGALIAGRFAKTAASELIFPAEDSVLTKAQSKKLTDELNSKFLGFAVLGDGSAVGLWDDDGKPTDNSGVVLLGAHGEYLTLAPDLVTFLWMVARQDFKSEDSLAELLPERVYQKLDGADEDELGDCPEERSDELARWLEQETATKKPAKKSKVSAFKSKVFQALKEKIYFRTPEQIKAAEEEFDGGDETRPRVEDENDPLMKKLAQLLKPHKKEGGVISYAAGPHMVFYFTEISATEVSKPVPKELAAKLKPILAELREDFGKAPNFDGQPQGLWTEVVITIGSDAVSAYPALSEDPFPIGFDEFPDSFFRQDHKKIPWPAEDIPDWLKKKLK